jgi:hypothetical protein
MKTRWWMTACAAALLALICGTGVAQGQNDKKNEKGENRGQSKKQYRQFQENQRQYARTYYGQHQNHEVFKPDSRWNNDYANRLQPGYVLDRDMQRMSRPAPYDMIRGLGRAPRGYRYIVIGGHVVLVDNRYRVHDTIRFELDFGH